MKKFFSLFLMLFLIVALVACGATSESTQGDSAETGENGGETEGTSDPAGGDEAIKIGFISSATEHASSQGKTEMDAAMYLKEKLKDEGIEIITYDDQSDETTAVLNIKKLISEDNVSIVVGGTITGTSLAMAEVAETEEVPLISMAAGEEIVVPVKPFVFKTAQSNDLVLHPILEDLQKKNMTKVAWLHVEDAYGESGYDAMEKLASEYGIEIVAKETFNATDTDMTAQLSNIKLKDPDATVVWTRPPSGAILTKNYKELGFTAPLYHSHGMANNAFLEQSGEFANDVILGGGKLFVKDGLPDDDPQKELLNEFTEEFGEALGYEPTNFTGYAYDGIMLAVEAVKNAGSDPAAIRDYLENSIQDFVGVTGVFTFSPEDHNGLSPESATLMQVKDVDWAPYE